MKSGLLLGRVLLTVVSFVTNTLSGETKLLTCSPGVSFNINQVTHDNDGLYPVLFVLLAENVLSSCLHHHSRKITRFFCN